MSKTGFQEDEDEFFYESLDRIVSSSCSSAASTNPNSDVEDVDASPSAPSNYAFDQPFPVPEFPLVSFKYDVWISQPSSISERRSRLLSQMGLSSDPSLSRSKPGGDGELDQAEFGRLADSSDPLDGEEIGCGLDIAGTVLSKSDSEQHRYQCNSSSPSILSIYSSVAETGSFVNNHNIALESRSNGSPVVAVVASNKPPTGKHTKKMDEIQIDSGHSNANVRCNGEDDEDLECNTIGRISDVYTIKNLDNGKEFVVNEIREDGTWNKVREVGTGRQLTMEEFEMTVGHSPIVQELMRRQNVEECNKENSESNWNGGSGCGSKLKKKSNWFKSITTAASTITGHKERRSSDDKDTSSEKGGRRSSSATDDSQDSSFHGPERVRVKQYGKSIKDLTAVYKSQELQAHNGSIWTIKFSLDGRYLASAGEDCVIHVWQVLESERKGELLDRPEDGHLNLLFLANGSPEPTLLSPTFENQSEKKRRGRTSINRKSVGVENIMVPETVFGLSEKPVCSFQGHLDDVLDLSWSKSQHLLSSSMDKTVRLWHLTSMSCLKVFSHSDYVTCIQFNPVDDRYFISGSLDAKVRIWSIPDHKVVDWNDLHEMVTAACYTPDGQGALVGSYKGSCRLYNTAENKLQQKSQINLQNKKKKPHQKKITGFQFAPGSSSEVLITSTDSRIRVIDGVDLVHKFKGFRNTNSQISASLTTNGKYVVCASEDSYVYVWRHESDSRPSRSKGITVTQSYENFHCQDVSVAIPWPGLGDLWGLSDIYSGQLNRLQNNLDEVSMANPPTPVQSHSRSASACANTNGTISSVTSSYMDRILATWPEEKQSLASRRRSRCTSLDLTNGVRQNMLAWGMVIVTAGLRGEIRIFQNFGFPVRI